MIDITKAKKTFREYVKKFDPKNEKIKLKIDHIERTSQVAKKLATDLKLEKEDIELAELIGLLHDIGRFEQIKRYNTFVDKNSINHSKLGVEILFQDGWIRKFIEDDKYDEIIKKAILNHNKSRIEENLSQRETLHSKIIRDSDKTDIFYILTFDKTKTIYGVEDFSNQKISDEVYREYMEDKLIDYNNLNNEADILVAHFAYVYDFYFNYGLKVLQENDYITKLYKRYKFSDEKTMNMYNNVYKCSLEYVNNRLKQ